MIATLYPEAQLLSFVPPPTRVAKATEHLAVQPSTTSIASTPNPPYTYHNKKNIYKVDG